MRHTWLILVIVIALLLAWARVLHGQEGGRVQGDPSSLKLRDNLAYATEIARRWQEDAILVGAEANQVKEDGTVNITDPVNPAGRIVYFFYSPRVFGLTSDLSLAHRRVALMKGTITLEDDDVTLSMTEIPEDFKDMDEVWKAARTHGASGLAYLRLQHDAGRVEHNIYYLFIAGPIELQIDALTCEVIE